MEDKQNSSKFFTQETNNISIADTDYVKFYHFKNRDIQTIEATIMQKQIKPKNNWVKLNKTQMVNKETGEIKEMKRNVNRGSNISGIKRTQKGLVRIINYNFPTDIQTLHFVLTYAIPMFDWQTANNDFSYFRSRLKRKYKSLEYL